MLNIVKTNSVVNRAQLFFANLLTFISISAFLANPKGEDEGVAAAAKDLGVAIDKLLKTPSMRAVIPQLQEAGLMNEEGQFTSRVEGRALTALNARPGQRGGQARTGKLDFPAMLQGMSLGQKLALQAELVNGPNGLVNHIHNLEKFEADERVARLMAQTAEDYTTLYETFVSEELQALIDSDAPVVVTTEAVEA